MSQIECPKCGRPERVACIVLVDYHEHYCRGCCQLVIYLTGPFASDLDGDSLRTSVGRCAL